MVARRERARGILFAIFSFLFPPFRVSNFAFRASCFAVARSALAVRAEIAAAAGDDGAANRRPAAEAFLAFAIIDAVLQLKFALLAR